MRRSSTTIHLNQLHEARVGMIDLIFTPEGYVNPWIALFGVSVLIGVASGALLRGRIAVVAGAALPWCALLGLLLWFEFITPPASGGASMWPVAQLVGGTAAAVLGGFSARGVQRVNH